VLVLVGMFLAAIPAVVVIAHLAARLRAESVLYEMIRELAVTNSVEELGQIAVRHARELLNADVVILISRSGGPTTSLASSDASGALADAALAGDTTLCTESMVASRGQIGVFATRAAAPRAFKTLVAQTALAIERAQLAGEAEQAHVLAESERTRNTLLAGLSHDLRTPLLSIGGSAGVLLDRDAALDKEQRHALLTTVRDEAQKLTRLVTGLLDLVHIESGKVQILKEWYPLEEILSSALSRLDTVIEGRSVKTRLGGGSELLMVAADPILIEQVFVNLLDNAAKYTPAGTPIEIVAEVIGGEIRIDVADQGRGIAPGDERRVFQKFYRSEKSTKTCSGAGLGLALCDAIVRAHGGHIEAGRGSKTGSVFSVYLPLDIPRSSQNELAQEAVE
jgi:two-component system, OmpR family, sensor histidine kinase KdpD